jgi:hypothetical protein
MREEVQERVFRKCTELLKQSIKREIVLKISAL